MVAGLIGSDDYTEQMMMNRSPVGDDLEAEAQAAEDAVLAEWTDDVLKTAIRAGGFKGGADVAGQGEAVRPASEDVDGRHGRLLGHARARDRLGAAVHDHRRADQPDRAARSSRPRWRPATSRP